MFLSKQICLYNYIGLGDILKNTITEVNNLELIIPSTALQLYDYFLLENVNPLNMA
jgi:hypothetical protein